MWFRPDREIPKQLRFDREIQLGKYTEKCHLAVEGWPTSMTSSTINKKGDEEKIAELLDNVFQNSLAEFYGQISSFRS
jgi:hypothetical protein